MVFFAAAVVKAAVAVKKEVKKNRIRNSVILAPGEASGPETNGFSGTGGAVTIAPDWWGGNGGSYVHDNGENPSESLNQPTNPHSNLPSNSSEAPRVQTLPQSSGSDFPNPVPSVAPNPALPASTPTPALPASTPTPALPASTPIPVLPASTPTPALPAASPPLPESVPLPLAKKDVADASKGPPKAGLPPSGEAVVKRSSTSSKTGAPQPTSASARPGSFRAQLRQKNLSTGGAGSTDQPSLSSMKRANSAPVPSVGNSNPGSRPAAPKGSFSASLASSGQPGLSRREAMRPHLRKADDPASKTPPVQLPSSAVFKSAPAVPPPLPKRRISKPVPGSFREATASGRGPIQRTFPPSDPVHLLPNLSLPQNEYSKALRAGARGSGSGRLQRKASNHAHAHVQSGKK